MIKTLTNVLKQDKEKFAVPRKVQDIIPVRSIWTDGVFMTGKNKFSKMWRFTDINYAVASRDDKAGMFLGYSELLNSLDSGCTAKITINNRRLNMLDFEDRILLKMMGDPLDVYRKEYNDMLTDKATGSNAIIQDKYITISVNRKSIEDARLYFARIGADLTAHFSRLGSKCIEMTANDRLRIIHDFMRTGEETSYHFDLKDHMRKGHDFRDYICPDVYENNADYFKVGNRFGRVLLLRDYASYISDDMVAEITDLSRNLMLSIDIVPIPTDEAVKEVEQRLLGVETNITNWQRKQNMNNNFSAVIPYDMEQQRKETKQISDTIEILSKRTAVKDTLNSSNFDNYLYPSRYNVERDMIRYFSFEFIDEDEISEDVDWNNKISNINADGVIYGIIPHNEESIAKIGRIIESTAADCERVIFILPKHFVEIEEVVREFEAVTILRDNANDDKVLFDEYEVIYDDLREVIMSFTRGYTHPDRY